MKRVSSIIAIALGLLLSALCFADTPYALFVENRHWIYDAMHILSVESRQATLVGIAQAAGIGSTRH